MEAGCNCEPFWWIERINAILSLSPHFRVGGVFRYRSGERLHGMQEVSGSIPLFSTNQEQNEHEVTIQMVGNVFVLFCELPCVTTS